MKKKVFVAMSGGVDSSVAAALMKEAGFDVVGIFMKHWNPGKNGENCLWKEDREYALRVAAKLDIPLLTWDLSKEYEKRVAKYMVEGYKKGITPNPDVMCNKFIKFGVFLERALEIGADYIATGHYARIKRETLNSKSETLNKSQILNPKIRLLKAKDPNKDQSYFLYTLTQKQLKHCLFPIGDYTKPEVRKIAKKFGLPNWDKKDSQGVCFVGELKMDEFLKQYIKPKRGLVIRESDGEVIGRHDGVWYYTIGQRHGLGSSAGGPYYVVEKDIKKNILYVDEEVRSKNHEVRIKEFNWVKGKENLPLDCKVKLRYRQPDLDCTVVKNGGLTYSVKLDKENLAVPGQAAVFYKGDELIGGGIIAKMN